MKERIMATGRRILMDWGTTNVRAYRLDGAGNIVERREGRHGIMNVPDGAFHAAFDTLAGDWRNAAPEAPVLISGMIGSRQGWIEAPYAACPVDANELSRDLTPVPDLAAAWIVPGVLCRSNGRHDVMRGEEVQIFGALSDRPRGRRVVCLPGTHSKWAVVEDGTLIRFDTAMTGEVYQVLSEHSILRKLMTAGGDEVNTDAFGRGLDRSRGAGGLLNHLFGVRAEGLFGTIPADGLRSYLSGILIGHEIAGLGPATDMDAPVLLVGAPALTRLYGVALAHFGMATDIIDADKAAVTGLTRVAAAAGI